MRMHGEAFDVCWIIVFGEGSLLWQPPKDAIKSGPFLGNQATSFVANKMGEDGIVDQTRRNERAVA